MIAIQKIPKKIVTKAAKYYRKVANHKYGGNKDIFRLGNYVEVFSLQRC